MVDRDRSRKPAPPESALQSAGTSRNHGIDRQLGAPPAMKRAAPAVEGRLLDHAFCSHDGAVAASGGERKRVGPAERSADFYGLVDAGVQLVDRRLFGLTPCGWVARPAFLRVGPTRGEPPVARARRKGPAVGLTSFGEPASASSRCTGLRRNLVIGGRETSEWIAADSGPRRRLRSGHELVDERLVLLLR
jgi:hypothetical protein